ncbi:inorganic phosphate transporter [Peptococcaceae bacterium 1198_IL3148]
MSESVFILIIIILALVFDFINGFHDTANAVATSIATGALLPRQAIILASTLNFIGALVFTGVAQTIGDGIANPKLLTNGLGVVLAALLASIIWNLATWYWGLPSSSSHALVGSLAGAVTAAVGFSAVNVPGILNIIKSLLFSPLLALFTASILMLLCQLLILSLNLPKTNLYFKKMQIFTAAFQAFSHGTNDAQKTMGIIVFTLVTAGWQPDLTIPLWVKISAATAMALGTSVGGWRIINTVGQKITPLRPTNGLIADISSATIIITATLLKLPVSTTHVISSSVIGVGIVSNGNSVNWQVVRKMITTWAITIPSSFLLGMSLYNLMTLTG